MAKDKSDAQAPKAADSQDAPSVEEQAAAKAAKSVDPEKASYTVRSVDGARDIVEQHLGEPGE